MREGWHKTTIGTLISSGAIQVHKDGNHGANYPRVDDFGTDGLPFLTAKSISDWTIDFQGAPRLSREKAKTFKFGFVEGGDVLLSHNATVGRVAIVPEGEATAVIGTSLTQFRVDRSQILPEFLALYFSSREFQEQLSFVMAQTTRNQVPITEQRKLPIQLPDLGAQQAIVDVAFGLIDKIELNRKMNATLEAMARALFRDWFVDFGPTRAKMEGRAPYLSPDLWSLFPDRLDDEGKPERWEEKPLTEFFAIIGGGTPKTSNAEFWDGPIPWFSVTDTPPNGSVFVTNTEKTITDAGLNGSSARLVPKGTTIISARGTVGNLAVAGRDMTFNQSCYGLRGVGSVGDYATFLIAQNMVSQLQAMAHGSVFSTITRQTFESLSLPMPNDRVLRAFEDAASPLFDKILANVRESRTLAQTRDLLLPRLMSGELRVAEAERLAEEVA